MHGEPISRMDLTAQNNQRTTYILPARNTVSQLSLPLYQIPTPPSVPILQQSDEPPSYASLF